MSGRLITRFGICVLIGLLGRTAHAADPIDPPPPFDLSRLTPAAAVRPRLFLTRDRLAALRQAITTTHADLWAVVRKEADERAREGPPAYRATGDGEQLWQRPVGNAMPTLALAYLLTDDRKYLDAATAFATASCGYATWGRGTSDGLDLAAGHQLLGLAILYDWCHGDLDESTRRTIRGTLLRRANVMYQGVLAGKTFWGRAYLQNHLWVDGVGLVAAALALADEPDARPDAANWLGFVVPALQRTMDSLGDDGASQEGVAYWEYGVEYLLKYMQMSRDLLGIDYFKTSVWMKRTAEYPVYLSLPRNVWTRKNSIVDMADCPRTHWYGPEYLCRKLAAEYDDGHAQWYARQIDDAGVASDGATWLNLLWDDPKIAPRPPSDLPTLRHFTDMDIVSARTDWSGDESLVVFKCGPFIGHKAIEAFTTDPGGGHVHPDANHFVIFGDGQWLIRADGYRVKMTANQNTLLVDKKGQFGEGSMWFNPKAALAVKASPRVTLAASTPGLDRISGDATAEYPADVGLTRYRRHLLFLKPDVLIVIDDLRADHAADFDLRFHPEADTAVKDGNAILTRTGGVALRADLLTPDQATWTFETVSTRGRTGEKPTDLLTLRAQSRRTAWRTATAFSWAKDAATPAVVTLRQTPTKWTFDAGGRTVDFDWAAEDAK